MTAPKPLILIAEDDPALCELLTYNLRREGFDTFTAADGADACAAAEHQTPDLMILDWMIPNVPGIDVCRRIRRSAKTRALPVIMLTARGEEEDRVRGLDSGADDYVTKPFSPKELTARVRALLRRAAPAGAAETLACGDVEMDLTAHRVTRAGADVRLSPAEFRLLRVFLERPGRVFSRGQLLDQAWGRGADIDLRTVDVRIRRLRRALNAGGGNDLIRTVRSAGYALDAASA